jgi:hypothetical protein
MAEPGHLVTQRLLGALRQVEAGDHRPQFAADG